MRKIPGSDIEVTKEDQTNINSFSKLFSKNQDNQTQMTSLKEKINQHKDTLDEMELNDDDDPVRYRFGACFFTMPSTPLILFSTSCQRIS